MLPVHHFPLAAVLWEKLTYNVRVSRISVQTRGFYSGDVGVDHLLAADLAPYAVHLLYQRSG